MIKQRSKEIIFKHLVELSGCDCVFCSTREKETGLTRLFLIFHDQRRIYTRNGINGTWDELEDQDECIRVRQKFQEVVGERKIPCFTTER